MSREWSSGFARSHSGVESGPDLQADEKGEGGNLKGQSRNLNGPSDKVWSFYVNEAEKFDKALVESWKADMEGIVIFAGLFSASVTAFIIEGYTTLSPDPSTRTITLLAQISSQLAAISNGTNPNLPSPPPPLVSFRPPASAVAVNILWFFSLAFGLVCALGATMVQQWARNYLQLIERRPAPGTRARIRSFLYEGIETFRMKAVVEAIPALLHVSLFLFFIGLVIFLFPISLLIAATMLTILVLVVAIYMMITLLPAYYPHCPYRTPLSWPCWRISRLLTDTLKYGITHRRHPIYRGMSEGQEKRATMPSAGRKKRDVLALLWTVKSLSDDSAFERFLEALPPFLHSHRVSVWREADTLNRLDKSLWEHLFRRLLGLFESCKEAEVLEPPWGRRRAVVCMTTLQSLATVASENILHQLKHFCPRISRTLMVLEFDRDATIACLSTCTSAVMAFTTLSSVANDIPSKPEYINDWTDNDERLLENLTMILDRSDMLGLSREDMDEALLVLGRVDISDAVDRFITRYAEMCGGYSYATVEHLIAPLHREFDMTQLARSLEWMYGDAVIREAGMALKLFRDPDNAESTRNQVIPKLSRMFQLVKTRKTREAFLSDGCLTILTSLVSRLIRNQRNTYENTDMILRTLRRLVGPHLSASKADLDTQAAFVHIVEEAMSQDSPFTRPLPFQAIEVLFQVFDKFDHPTTIELAVNVIDGNEWLLNCGFPREEILDRLKARLPPQAEAEHSDDGVGVPPSSFVRSGRYTEEPGRAR